MADVWARLTAAESQQLDHAQALGILESRAGYHFDPRVVYAAVEVVRNQHLSSYGDEALRPHCHEVPLPGVMARLRGPAIGLG